MRYLTGAEESEARRYMEIAMEAAKQSTCLRSRCGSVLVKDGEVIGIGFNSPPKNKKPEKCLKEGLPANFKSDKTCCIHAEQRAIMNALKEKPKMVAGSRIYFIRLDPTGKKEFAGDPYCTYCSKLALDAEVCEFVLWHEGGICVYDTEEYNAKSFQYVG